MAGPTTQETGPCRIFSNHLHFTRGVQAAGWQQHQRKIYSLMIQCCWDTLKTFSQNDKQLQGIPGAIAVLQTHSRCLDFHPHVHVVIPAAAINQAKRLWRTKTAQSKGKSEKKKSYLFNHKALAKAFLAKMLEAITKEGLALPKQYPEKWVVDCKSVGSGEKAGLKRE